MVEADERPPPRPPLRAERRELVGPKSKSPCTSDAAIAASGVNTLVSMNEAATIVDPTVLATPLSSVEAFGVDDGAKATEGATDIAATATAKAETLTILIDCLFIECGVENESNCDGEYCSSWS
jgi:hypothetical protein